MSAFTDRLNAHFGNIANHLENVAEGLRRSAKCLARCSEGSRRDTILIDRSNRVLAKSIKTLARPLPVT